MTDLKEVLLNAERRNSVVDDCVQLVEDEVASKTGLTGVAVKGAFMIVKKIKPGMIREAVENLLDEFVERLQPFYSDYQQDGANAFESYLTGRATEVADALLGVTDARAERTRHGSIKKAYGKLRPSGMKHVQAAVPGIARVIQRHV